MSSNYPPPSALGNIATGLGSFAQGYMNAKMMARDREERDRARLHDRAQALMQLAEHPMAANNPSMKAALTEAAFSAWDEADAGPAKKGTKQHGLGALMKRMVGAGGYNAAPPQGPGPMRTMLNESEKNRQAAIQKENFEAPDRGDYGSSGLQNFLGPAASNPVSTQTPDAGMSRDRAPGLSMTPEENMSHAAPAPAPIAQYAQQPRTQSPVQASATANYANNVISPDKLIRSATVAHTGKYGFQDTAAIQRDVQIQAHHIINDLLDHVDSFIDVTPGHETLEQAYAHPQIRQALDGIRQYAHLTGQKFEDIVGGRFPAKGDEPSYSLTQVAGPDGSAGYAGFNPKENTLTPIKGASPYIAPKDPKEPNLKNNAAAALKKQHPDWDDARIYQEVERLGAAPHQAQVYHMAGINPTTGRNEIIEVTEGGGKRYTGIQVADQFDPKALMLPDRVTGYDAFGNPITSRTYDPVLVQQALAKNLVGPSFIQLIVGQRKQQIQSDVARENSALVGPALDLEVAKRTASDPLIMQLGAKAANPFTR